MGSENQAVIVFFSKDGNTRSGAKRLNERLGCKVIELQEQQKGNFLQALFKKGSKLHGNPWHEITDATDVYLMQPIWASNAVPAMNTFLEHADFSGKRVTIITFQQFADLRNSDKVHQDIAAAVKQRNGQVIGTHAFIGGKMGHCAAEKVIFDQIDALVLPD
ncbi:flavodoxin family protein [Acetobacterium sp.]|uniref:flavodoxin family protein n=1 Tax=Acetobacterium sp. TaxID=1872094 RepID=UPI0035939D60